MLGATTVGSTDPPGRESHGERCGGRDEPKGDGNPAGRFRHQCWGAGVSPRSGNCSTHTCLCAFNCEFILVAQCQVEMKEVGVTL